MLIHLGLPRIFAEQIHEKTPIVTVPENQRDEYRQVSRGEGVVYGFGRWLAEKMRVQGDHRVVHRAPGHPVTRRSRL